MKSELLGITSKSKKLVPGAYPTIFDHVPKVRKRPESEARCSASSRKLVVATALSESCVNMNPFFNP